MTTERGFVNNLGFDDNPFRFTDADQEERLKEYFVPPPYFSSVFGDPEHPSSVVVFAPRGGGKSAQRRMVEMDAPRESILCFTYDLFPFLDSTRPSEVTLSLHLREIIRGVLVGILSRLYEDRGLIKDIGSDDKKTLAMLVQLHIGTIGELELNRSLQALKTVPEKVKDWFISNLSTIGNLVSLITTQFGLPPLPSLSQSASETSQLRPEDYLFRDLQTLGKLTTKIGLKAIYVLIDKVDESSKTANNAEAAYFLVRPIVSDLRLLSLNPFCFKLFLPEYLEEYYIRDARPDRIQQHKLSWKWTDLRNIMIRRLQAFSGKRIANLTDIVSIPTGPDGGVQSFYAQVIESLIFRFAENSPRDMIRIWQSVFAEQQRLNPNQTKIQPNAITQGIDEFCSTRARELAADPVMLGELKKVGRADFTVNFVANEIFKIQANSARNKIQKWVSAGMVARVAGIVGQRSTRPAHHYALADVRVAREVFSQSDLSEFVSRKIMICQNCDATMIRDFDRLTEQTCKECSYSISRPGHQPPVHKVKGEPKDAVQGRFDLD